MAKKPKVAADRLYVIATYLARPETLAEFHAELPKKQRANFEAGYAAATSGYPLPTHGRKDPYYVWSKNPNKRGIQLRIYFARVSPEPPLMRGLCTDHGKWYAKRGLWRINHSNLVMQMFECGFVLGKNSGHEQRIADFMKVRFSVVP